ncbi:hypothetical protein HDU96_004421, partial [Phlyctochytrium bullatum]
NPRPKLLPILEEANASTLQEAARTLIGLNRIVELGRAVFSLFWLDIATLTISAVSSWPEAWNKRDMAETAKRCNEVFSFIERRHISWELLPRDFRAEIAFEMEEEHGGDQDYYHLLDSFTFREFWYLRASRIAKFLQQKNSGGLPKILRATFERHGVEMPDQSYLIRKFSAGTLFCQAEQVVATLLAGQYEAFCPVRDQRLEDKVYYEGLGWVEAFKKLFCD